MCDPVSMAVMSFAVSAAGSVVGFMGQQSQYEQAMIEKKANDDNARTATINAWEATQIRAQQEGAAGVQKKFEANIETAKAVGTATTAAGEGGVSGLSVDAMLGDLYAKKGRHADAVDNNLQMTRNYLSREMDAQRATGQNQINSMPIPEAPNFAATLVNIFGAGVKSFGAFKDATA